MSDPVDVVYFRNRRAWRMRVVQVAVWGGTGLVIWLTSKLGTNPNDSAADFVVVPILAALCVAAVIVFELFQRQYLLEIRGHEGQLIFTTLATLHHRQFTVSPSQVTLGHVEHRNNIQSGIATVHRNIVVHGRRWPLIIDMTFAPSDSDALAALVHAAGRTKKRNP